MTEEDYIKATNLAKIKIIKVIMRDIMEGPSYGICEQDYREVTALLVTMVNTANDSFEVYE